MCDNVEHILVKQLAMLCRARLVKDNAFCDLQRRVGGRGGGGGG
jgi:hypothetical protein